MRRPGFEPGLPDWQSDVLDQTGRSSPIRIQLCWLFSLFYLERNCFDCCLFYVYQTFELKIWCGSIVKDVKEFLVSIS